MSSKYNVKIFPSPDKTAEGLFNYLKNLIDKELNIKDRFNLAVSGGSTPNKFFSLLTKANIPWHRIHIFWVDERCVPSDHNESNYGNAEKIFISKINIPQENIHRVKGESDPPVEMMRYGEELIAFVTPVNNSISFDWILLGMGNDGHTASLFPDQSLLSSYKDVCGIAGHPQTGQKRITLTYSAINSAERITFLITEKSKAHVLKKVLLDKDQNYPAARIKPLHGNINWYIDEEAASQL